MVSPTFPPANQPPRLSLLALQRRTLCWKSNCRRSGSHREFVCHRTRTNGSPTVVARRPASLFARWDYIDRDAVTHQNLWAARPDGTNPVAVWGNASPKPALHVPGQSRFRVQQQDRLHRLGSSFDHRRPGLRRRSRGRSEQPGRGHADHAGGPFPEAESGNIPEYYESPWPLAEDCFLVSVQPRSAGLRRAPRDPNPDNALGLYLLDPPGNRELLYRDPQIGSTNPMPLVAQCRAAGAAQHARAGGRRRWARWCVTRHLSRAGRRPAGHDQGIADRADLPQDHAGGQQPADRRGRRGKRPGDPGHGAGRGGRSARFLVPALKPLLFQALDQDGFAYQTMRSTTYVQPGERIACVGCHEHQMTAPTPATPWPCCGRRRASSRDHLGGRLSVTWRWYSRCSISTVSAVTAVKKPRARSF